MNEVLAIGLSAMQGDMARLDPDGALYGAQVGNKDVKKYVRQ